MVQGDTEMKTVNGQATMSDDSPVAQAQKKRGFGNRPEAPFFCYFG